MKYFFSLLGSILISGLISGQNSLTIDLDKDAGLRYKSGYSYGSTNYGTNASWHCLTSASGAFWRSVAEVDISSVPAGAVIISATLVLKVINQNQTSGSNAVTFHKTDNPWDESTVTWNNQSSFTTAASDPVIPAGSTGFVSVDLTDWVRSAIVNAESSIEFVAKLVHEDPNTTRRMSFASSDNPTSSNRPKITIVYYDNDIFMEAHNEPVNDIYDLSFNSINVQFDENFLSNAQSISYEIRDEDNVVVVSQNSSYMTQYYLFTKIDPSSYSLTDNLIYEIIFYNDQGSKRYLKFKK